MTQSFICLFVDLIICLFVILALRVSDGVPLEEWTGELPLSASLTRPIAYETYVK